MTSPAPSTSAPPELPGLIAASVWMASITVASSEVPPVATARSVALMIPSVTVLDSPSGAPMATAMSPTCTSSESAKVAGVRSSAACSRRTARSEVGSVPTISASWSVPSAVRTCTVPPPATTWLLVSTYPSSVRTTPEPLPEAEALET
jgi:hypothetical protein